MGKLIRMSLARIVVVDGEDEKMSMVVLREVDGERAFPILIGLHEGYAIDRRTKHILVQRPMTHDLLEHTIKKLDYELDQIVIHELRDSTFYAKLVLRGDGDGDVVEIDSRPSDALAVGAGTETPIFVDESVLQAVC